MEDGDGDVTDVEVHDSTAERIRCCELCLHEAIKNREDVLAVDCCHRLLDLLPKQVTDEPTG